MESLVDAYKGKKVLVTGNTGFKGSWLTSWLRQMGADVTGYSSEIPTQPSHHELLSLDIETHLEDIRDVEKLSKVLHTLRPDIVFHMAAQPLVRRSYSQPMETFEINVMGTAGLLQGCRGVEELRGVVVVTTDKCYENREWVHGYRENDPLGGYDPYSASKAAAEIVTSSYRQSFFNPAEYGVRHQTLIATARAGNVVGGGDWSEDRLIPDIIRSTLENQKVILRNPEATRPWQHVLEPLSGYLMLGQKLMEGQIGFADAWNFGPRLESNRSVQDTVSTVRKYWNRVEYETLEKKGSAFHEAGLLMLDSSKAHHKLGWTQKWSFEETLAKTIGWYRSYYEEKRILTEKQIGEYCGSV